MRAVLFPTTLAELFDLWRRHPDASLLAGGTDLLVQLRRRAGKGGALLCLERIPELSRVEELPDGGTGIGGCVSFARIASDPLLRERCPVLTRAAATVGGPAIRNMATIGGNIATASPAGDSLPPLSLLGAAVELRSATTCRTIPLGEFIVGPRRTTLHAGELVCRILLPSPGVWSVHVFEKVGRRKSLAIAVASLAAMVRLEDGRVAEARFAWGSVGETVVRCPAAEAALVGCPLDEASLRAAAAPVGEAVRPIDDLRATADYRRTVAANLLLRLVD